MNRTLLTLTLAAQLAAVGAFAQTGTATTGTGTADTSMSFGSDWSSTLGPAMMGADGTTVRPSAELVSQWATLSDDDKAMIRRDCMAYMQHSGSTDSSTTTGSGTASGTSSAPTGTTGSATGTTSGMTSPSVTPVSVTMEQMEEICAATKDF